MSKFRLNGAMPPSSVSMDSDFQEAVAHEGVVPEVALQHQLQPVEVAREMPFDRMAEVLFPDIEREAHRAEQMRRLELGVFRRDVVEMSVAVRHGRRQIRRRARAA